MKARENPFRSERIERIPIRVKGATVEELATRAVGLRACAIVGPEGTGKTTLLEALAARFEGRGFEVQLVRVRPESLGSGLCDLPWGEGKRALLLDGLEGVGRRARPLLSELVRRTDLLVATAHRAGSLPTLIEVRTSPALLEELVRELVEEEAFGGVRSELPDLLRRHRGNIRECFRVLYDRWAERRGAGSR